MLYVCDGTGSGEAARACTTGSCASATACASCTEVYRQPFEDPALYPSGVRGAVTFRDGTEFVDSGGFSVLRSAPGRSGGSALELEPGDSFGPTSIQLAFVTVTRAGEGARAQLSFYNPTSQAVTVTLQRVGGAAETVSLGAGWSTVDRTLRSTLSTGRVLVQLGALPRGQRFRIDDVVIESCP